MAASPAIGGPSTSDRVAEQMEKILEKRIEEDKLVLPALPSVATRCLELIKNPDFSMKTAAEIIEKDPLLTVQVLRLANSAAMGAREPIRKVLDAFTRLGVQKLRTFLVEAAARRLFDSKDTRIIAINKVIWEHSLAVASVSTDIAALANVKDGETAYLAGLLHDVGKPVVAGMLLEVERNLSITRPGAAWIGSGDWVQVIQKIHRKVGLRLAQKWELPEPVVRAIRDCEEYDSADRLSAANSVRLANALVKEQGIYEGEIAKDDVEALVMIGQSMMGVDAAACHQLALTAKNNLKKMTS